MTDTVRTETAYNDQQTGRFVAGNPGRPKGARTRFSQETLREIAGLKSDAVEVLKNRLAANDGDVARWVLERIIGRNAQIVELSGVTPDDVGRDLLDGAISIEQAKDLAQTMVRLMEVEKIGELERKVEELNNLLKETSYAGP
ncbi:MAG: hypothetical protein DI498_11445 [Paracoccus denitrificans]|nr:MAG: hypothetical protein DI498_11445 [Paracoccus denitrificans]PZO83476.1 MAG: hypothetical protein DI633_11445 [Paracoccus denitrificans]